MLIARLRSPQCADSGAARHCPPCRRHCRRALTPLTHAGLGMNEDELRRNPVLTDFVVHDLNVDPTLPYNDNSFDVRVSSSLSHPCGRQPPITQQLHYAEVWSITRHLRRLAAL